MSHAAQTWEPERTETRQFMSFSIIPMHVNGHMYGHQIVCCSTVTKSRKADGDLVRADVQVRKEEEQRGVGRQ